MKGLTDMRVSKGNFTMEANNAKQYYTEDGGRKIDAIAAQLYSKIVDGKKVSKATVTEEEVKNILRHIETLNALDMYTRSIDGLRFDEILIPKCFSDFVLPRRVVLFDDDRMPDLIVRPKVITGLMTEAEICSFTERLYGMYKKTAEYVSFENCRSDKFLNDINFAVVAGEDLAMKHVGNTWCVPIFVVPHVWVLTGTSYLQEDADYVLKKYLLNWKVESNESNAASE